MLKATFFLWCIFFFNYCFGQDEHPDSLLTLLRNSKEDTARVNILNQISASYFNSSPENSIKYATEAKELAEKEQYNTGLAYALKNIGIGYYMQADYIQTLTYWNQSLQEFKSINDKTGIANILSNLGAVYYNQGDDATALDYYLKALKYAEEIADTLRTVTVLNNIGAIYYNKKVTHDKALQFYLKALPLAEAIGDEDIGTIMVNIGEIYLEENEDSLALDYFKQSAKAYENSKNLPYSLNDIAKVYEKKKDYTTALKYHLQALDIATKLSARLEMSQSYQGVALVYSQLNNTPGALEAYKQAELIAKEISANYELEKIYKGMAGIYGSIGDYSNAYKYQSLLTTVKDSLYNAETDKKIAFLQFNFEIQKKQAEIDALTKDQALKDSDLKRQAIVRNSLIAVLSLVILVVFALFRNYRIKDKTNALLDAQKKELEETLTELKSTQSQLIHSEKMASLGELTAGIAHEIQNPLNFINNFSEINNELIEELREDGISKANEEELLNDITENNKKIAFHGRRADSIVKGMLQHSRLSTGLKEPTDINALCDEYLRLSYHGLRAKDKVFNADFKTDFDAGIGKINVVPQDIGRVLLNLLNNAFYTVNAKSSELDEGLSDLESAQSYQPLVKISTKKLPGKVEVRIEDNGNGIPENIKDKIFQPFFTTKPTGQGTGLGLSLAYDIITKEHKGSIEVKSEKGKGSTFIILLPA